MSAGGRWRDAHFHDSEELFSVIQYIVTSITLHMRQYIGLEEVPERCCAYKILIWMMREGVTCDLSDNVS